MSRQRTWTSLVLVAAVAVALLPCAQPRPSGPPGVVARTALRAATVRVARLERVLASAVSEIKCLRREVDASGGDGAVCRAGYMNGTGGVERRPGPAAGNGTVSLMEEAAYSRAAPAAKAPLATVRAPMAPLREPAEITRDKMLKAVAKDIREGETAKPSLTVPNVNIGRRWKPVTSGLSPRRRQKNLVNYAVMYRVRDELMRDEAGQWYAQNWDTEAEPCKWKNVLCNRYQVITRVVLVTPSKIPEALRNVTSIRAIEFRRGHRLEELPEWLGDMGKLQQLLVEGLGLLRLPESLNRARRLTQLNIKDEERLRRLPEGLFQLPRFKKLFLDKTGVDRLPPPGPAGRLSLVHVNDCPLTDIDSIASAVRLRQLSVNSGALTRLPAKHHWGASLVHLSLFCSGVKSIPAGFFDSMHRLEDLKLVADITSVPDGIGSPGKALKRVAISEAPRLRSLPDTIGNWTEVERVTLQACALDWLPPSIANWTRLTSIKLDSNALTELPASALPHWSSVVIMTATNNRLQSLPETIGALASLINLSLEGNMLTHLPAAIGRMKSLLTLNAGNNRLVRLPDEMGEMERLNTLQVENNPTLTDLGLGIGRLKGLHMLLAYGCGLRELPPNFGENLSRLTRLDISTNHIRALPPSVGGMGALAELHADNNMLEDLGPGVGLWKSVTYISISGNPSLQELPPSFAQLRNLKELIVSRCRLKRLPFKMMQSLKTLIVSSNELESLAEDIDLPALRNLNIQGNKLTSLPAGLARSTGLGSILASRNRLRYIPPVLLKTLPLSVMDLSHNYLTDDMLPSVPMTTNELLVRNNRLTRLPSHDVVAEAAASATNLHILDASENPISDLAAMSAFHNLRSFACTKCNLTSLPIEIANQAYLHTLKVSDNNIQHMPRGLLKALSDYRLGKLTARRVELQGNGLDSVGYGELSGVRLRSTNMVIDFAVLARAAGMGHLVNSGEFEGVSDLALSILNADPTADRPPWRLVSAGISSGDRICSLRSMSYRGRDLTIRVCECGAERYLARDGQCRGCIGDARCVDGRIDCVYGYLVGMETDEPACLPCPAGAVCTGSKVTARPGYWKPAGSNDVFSCGLTAKACLGGGGAGWDNSTVVEMEEVNGESDTMSRCAPGHHGPLCSVCDPGTMMGSSGQCIKCPSAAAASFSAVMMAFGFLLLLATLTLLGDRVARSAMIKDSNAQGGAAVHSMQTEGGAMDAGVLSQMIKMVMAFVQTLVAAVTFYDVDWSGWVAEIKDLFGWVNFDFLAPKSLECLWEHGHTGAVVDGATSLTGQYTYYESFLMMAGIPVATVMASGVLWLAARATRALLRPERGVPAAFIDAFCTRMVFMVLLMMYLPVSSSAFQFFKCRTFDEGASYHLSVDLSVECYDSTWYKHLPIVAALIGVYAVGWPVAILGLLAPRSAAPSLRRHYIPVYSNAAQVLENFFGVYKDRFRWWEAMEMGRQLLITSVAIQLGEHANFQLTVSLFICFFALLLQLVIHPFRLAFLNMLQTTHLVLTYLTLSIGILQSLEVPDSLRGASSTIIVMADLMLVAAVIFNVTAVLLYHGWKSVVRPVLLSRQHDLV